MTPIQMEVAEALRDSDAGNEERDAVVAARRRYQRASTHNTPSDAASGTAVSATPTLINVVTLTSTWCLRKISNQSKEASEPMGSSRGPKSPPMSAA